MSEATYLIFDFDGVIGDTKIAAAHATAAVSGMSYEDALADNMRYASNKPEHTRDHTLTDAEMKAVYDWTVSFGERMRDSHFELFTEFVSEIEKLPVKYKAVVSSGSQQYVIPALAKTNINPTHILAYENHHSKEEKIEAVCHDWGIDTKDVYYFTDTLADVYELKNFIDADKLIGVAWGYCGKAELSKELSEKNILTYPSDLSQLLS